MTNPDNHLDLDLDLDRLADLRLRLRHTRDPDPALGCAIVALLLPGTIAAASAVAWLAQSEGMPAAIGTGLDITGSVDDALRFLGQLGFGPGWSIIDEDLSDEPPRADGARHAVWLRHRFFDCSGRGQTRATALVDVAIHAPALGAAGYEEEELPPLQAGGGSAAHDGGEDPDERSMADAPDASWDFTLSEDPVERTRQVLGRCWPNLGMIDDFFIVAGLELTGRLCLKNRDGRFGAMDGYDLDAGILRVVDRAAPVSTRYDTLEDLLAAGWVLD